MDSVVVFSPQLSDARLRFHCAEIEGAGYVVTFCHDAGQLADVLRTGDFMAIVVSQDSVDMEAFGDWLWQTDPDLKLIVVGTAARAVSGWTDVYLRLPLQPGDMADALRRAER